MAYLGVPLDFFCSKLSYFLEFFNFEGGASKRLRFFLEFLAWVLSLSFSLFGGRCVTKKPVLAMFFDRLRNGRKKPSSIWTPSPDSPCTRWRSWLPRVSRSRNNCPAWATSKRPSRRPKSGWPGQRPSRTQTTSPTSTPWKHWWPGGDPYRSSLKLWHTWRHKWRKLGRGVKGRPGYFWRKATGLANESIHISVSLFLK